MHNVVVLGGGVGGTLTANLVARKLKKRISNGEARVTVVDATGAHAYQPGYMYIAMGQERAEKLVRPEKSLLDHNVELVVDEATRIDAAAQTVTLGSGTELPYDQLVIATGSRIVPGGDARLRHRGAPLLQCRGGGAAPQGARRVHRREDRDRHRRHPVQVSASPARGRVPGRVRAARARPARQDGDDIPVADQPGVHHRERLRHGDADLRARRGSGWSSSPASARSTPSARSSSRTPSRSIRTTC